MLELSPEDNLRLNVLLTQNLKAVRLDDSKLLLYALTDRGEARIQLNPNVREDKYLRAVRELLSMHALGSPGGYPVFIRRWTRMGQDRDEESLRKLLLLGEPEAVVAVAHTAGLTDAIAELAWWANPSAEIARTMLRSPHVAAGQMGRVLAQYLFEYLPFEDEHKAMIDSVRLMLQPGLIDDAQRSALWQRAGRRQTYYIGFLQALPDALPDGSAPHPEWDEVSEALATLTDNPYAHTLLRVLGAPGQGFLRTAARALDKLANQDAAAELFNAIGSYFRAANPWGPLRGGMDVLMDAACAHCDRCDDAALRATLEAAPRQRDRLAAVIALSLLSEYTVAPILGHTDAVGSVMRTRLQPVSRPVLELFARLCPTIKAH